VLAESQIGVDVDVQVDFTPPSIDRDDMEGMAGSVVKILLDEVQQQFQHGGFPQRWAPLKKGGPSYLFQSGALLQSLTPSTRKVAEDWIARVSTDIPFAPYHQFGTRYMPARPFMVLTEEGIDRIEEEALGYLVSVLESQPTKGVSKSNEF
jgi:phage gpG-like protein